MYDLTDKALAQMMVVLQGRRDELSTKETYIIENDVNLLRDDIKRGLVSDIDEHKYNYATGTAFMDLVSECERLCDYVVNVVEARFSNS